MPVKNGERWLARALESVLAQEHKDYELLVCDGGSTDNSARIIESYLDKMPLIFIQKKDESPNAATQVLQRMMTGDVAGFLMCDDVLLPNAFRRVSDTFSDYRVEWVYSPINLVNDEDSKTLFRMGDEPEITYAMALEKNMIPSEGMWVRTEVWRSVGGVSDKYKYADDYEFQLRLFKAGILLHKIQEDTVEFHVTGENRSRKPPHSNINNESEEVRREYQNGNRI